MPKKIPRGPFVLKNIAMVPLSRITELNDSISLFETSITSAGVQWFLFVKGRTEAPDTIDTAPKTFNHSEIVNLKEALLGLIYSRQDFSSRLRL